MCRQLGRVELALFSLAVLSLFGCSVGTVQDCEPSVAGETPAADQTGHEPARVQLTHDFGRVLPNSVNAHRFTFRNAEDDELSVTKVRSGCACATPRLSGRTVSPGGEIDVDVAWHAGNMDRDEIRDVRIELAGRRRVELTLEVRGSVRHDLAVSTSELALGRVPVDPAGIRRSFNVSNFSEQDWRSVEVDAPSWIWTDVAEIHAPALLQDRVAPRQAWRILTSIRSTELRPGLNSGELIVRPIGRHGEATQRTVRVTVEPRPAIIVIPSEVHLGSYAPVERISKTIHVDFADEIRPSSPEQVRVTFGRLDWKWEWKKTTGRTWELAFSCAAPREPLIVDEIQ